VKLVNLIYIQEEIQIKTTIGVKYLDQQSKTTQTSQYSLTLYKEDN